MLKKVLYIIEFLTNLIHFVIKTPLSKIAPELMLHILHKKSIPKWLPINHTTVDSTVTKVSGYMTLSRYKTEMENTCEEKKK